MSGVSCAIVASLILIDKERRASDEFVDELAGILGVEPGDAVGVIERARRAVRIEQLANVVAHICSSASEQLEDTEEMDLLRKELES